MTSAGPLQKVVALRSIANHLRETKPLTPELRSFLWDGFRKFLADIDSGAQPSLDRAFGLRSRGGVSPLKQHRLARRDDLLKALWRGLPAWNELPPIAAAKQMSQDARRYEATRWPRESEDVAAPSSEPAATWWRILRDHQRIPDAKRLQKILEAGISIPPLKFQPDRRPCRKKQSLKGQKA